MKKLYLVLTTLSLVFSHTCFCQTNKLIKQLEQQNFFASYLNYLKETKNFSPKGTWSEHEIIDAELITEAARPNRKFYNKTILWYQLQNKKIGFRPIDTTTGCNSGCSPLTFHLVFDEQGKTLAILKENGVPIRKTYHIPLSPEDEKKLLFLCQNFPEKLKLIDQVKELTDNYSIFPPQTLTFFKDTLIVGGAYTTFQIVSAAMKTKEYIAPDKELRALEKDEKKALLSIFENPISNSEEFLTTVKKVHKLLDTAKTPYIKKKLIDNILQAMHYAVTKEIIAPGKTREETLKFLIDNYLNTMEDYLLGAMQSQFYRFINRLLYSEVGQTFLLQLQKNLKFWNKLPENAKFYSPLLIYGQRNNKEALEENKKFLMDERFFNFSSQNSYFLSCYIKACLTVTLKEQGIKAYARLKVKYPKSDRFKELNMPKGDEVLTEKMISLELHDYTKELLREFSLSDAVIPQMNGILPFQKDKKITLPRATDKKQIYLFFAPWCAHCLQLIKSLGEEMEKSFWDKTQLVAVFSEDKKMLEEFIKRCGLKEIRPETVENLVMLGEGKEAEILYSEKLYLYGVPKAIVTNKEGKIINFSAAERLDSTPEKDAQRDLDLILSHF